MSKKYVVVYAGDDNYAMQIGVSMYSLLSNNPDMQLIIYIFSDGISEENCKKLNSVAVQFGAEIQIKKMPDLDQLVENELDTLNWAKAAYCRLFFTVLFPKDIDKVLWLDGDTLILDRITELLNMDIEEYGCASVIDSMDTFKKTHGFSRKDKYFNTGVLLINLKYWRDNQIYTKILQEICFRKGKSIDVDQSYINCILKGKIKVLPPEYNLMHRFFIVKNGYKTYLSFAGYKEKESYSEQAFLRAISHPVIYHFTGENDSRPWNEGCSFPGSYQWLEYLEKTPWRDYCLQKDIINTKETTKSIWLHRKKMSCFLTRLIYVKKHYGFWLRKYR